MRSRSLLPASIVVAAVYSVSVPAARAAIVVTVDKSTQTMSVAVDGAVRYRWPVSTARAGYSTPNGTYSPQRLEKTWFSKLYYNSPMPYSIFFHGGYAIHGSYEISRLGGPASHGCIRLHPSHAATLFSLVSQEGMGNTRIVVAGHSSAMAQRQTPASYQRAPGVPQYQPYYQPYYQPQYPRPYGGNYPFPYSGRY